MTRFFNSSSFLDMNKWSNLDLCSLFTAFLISTQFPKPILFVNTKRTLSDSLQKNLDFYVAYDKTISSIGFLYFSILALMILGALIQKFTFFYALLILSLILTLSAKVSTFWKKTVAQSSISYTVLVSPTCLLIFSQSLVLNNSKAQINF